MECRDLMRRLLEKNGAFVSGEELAAALGISRTAVWKQIAALRAEGCRIEAVPRRGYRLTELPDGLTAAAVTARLRHDCRVTVYDVLPSTNSALRERAEGGAPEGTVLIAAQQSAGRGRMGRSFYSPPDSGLYLSLLLRPTLPAEQAQRITTCAAVTTARAIEQIFGTPCTIKWVNDLFACGGKVCGILTEASLDLEGGGLQYAVLGIGINLAPPAGGFPPELRHVAASLLDCRQGDDRRAALAAALLDCFLDEYPRLTEPETSRRLLDEYRRRCHLIGRKVLAVRGGGSEEVTVLGIDDDYRLLVRRENGDTQALSSGEIRVRPLG